MSNDEKIEPTFGGRRNNGNNSLSFVEDGWTYVHIARK